MHVLEILNSYPGETFIQEHCRAILSGNVSVSWVFWQVDRPGIIRPVPVSGLRNCIGLTNPNRISKVRKAISQVLYGKGQEGYIRRQAKEIQQLKPDLIHFHFASLAAQHIKLIKSLGVPFTFSVRGSDVQVDPLVVSGFTDRLSEAATLARGIHTVSEGLKATVSTLAHVEPEKISVIRTAISSNWSSMARRQVANNFISIGRLHWRKGYNDLILAAAKLHKLGHQFTLTIVGEGNARQELEYMIRDLKLEDIVFLPGRKDHKEIAELMATADLYISTSIAEGFPNVVAEAMFSGVPVLAADGSNVSELFADGVDYLACSNSPESVCSGIVKYISLDEEQKKAMIDSAKHKATTYFSYDQHRASFEKLWFGSNKK